MKAVLLAVAACFAAGSHAQEIDKYAYFEKYGILDPGVSNRAAISLVHSGIRSEDSKIVELTVRALGRYALNQSNLFQELYPLFRSPHGALPNRDRSFADIPGLKEFLIEYWREQHRLSGGVRPYKVFGDAVKTEDKPDSQPSLDGNLLSQDIMDPAIPEWSFIPRILCILYPGDPGVLRFLWEREEHAIDEYESAGLEVSLGTLMLLNDGKFATPEVNALRIDMLDMPPDDDPWSASAAAAEEAARGLGLSRPVEAIPALLSIGAKLGYGALAGRGNVLATLAGYDDDALAPYAADIARLLERSRAEAPLGAVPEAIGRLDALVRRHSATGGFPVPPASPPRAPDIGLYKYFRDKGIFDPGVSSARANALVRGGMNADDARIVDATLRALGWFVAHQVHGFPLPYGRPPDRDFAAIPELKSLLMEHWRRQMERLGRDSLAGTAQGRAPSHEEMDRINRDTPAWMGIPRILCALYPGDADVLRFVWERHDGDPVSGNKLVTLSLLNIGAFATPQADALRLEVLAAPERGVVAARAARAAARGLAFSRPAEAIPHLLSAGLRHGQGEGEVLATLAGYGDDALLPHVGELARLLAGSSAPHPLGAVPEAIERLEAVVRLAAH